VVVIQKSSGLQLKFWVTDFSTLWIFSFLWCIFYYCLLGKIKTLSHKFQFVKLGNSKASAHVAVRPAVFAFSVAVLYKYKGSLPNKTNKTCITT